MMNFIGKKKEHLSLKTTVGYAHSEKLETVYNFLIKMKMANFKRTLRSYKESVS